MDKSLKTQTKATRQAKQHPWQEFLTARANVIDWMHEEGNSDADISRNLSMDAIQVTMIRERERS